MNSLPVSADEELIEIFDSQGETYRTAFQTFLDHTDQKEQARKRLIRLVEALPARRSFIDAGAGNGKVTAWFIDYFERTIAIEPNPHLRDELRRVCSSAEILADGILAARPAAAGDLVLCSHVFYYINQADWLPTLTRLASWLSPQGALAVVIQNHQSDCMRMLNHFYGRRFNLAQLAAAFRDAAGDRYEVELETIPATIETAELATAGLIAEFMLNLLPLCRTTEPATEGALPAPPRPEVAQYLRRHFAQPAGGFRFSCDQDFLIVRPRN